MGRRYEYTPDVFGVSIQRKVNALPATICWRAEAAIGFAQSFISDGVDSRLFGSRHAVFYRSCIDEYSKKLVKGPPPRAGQQ